MDIARPSISRQLAIAATIAAAVVVLVAALIGWKMLGTEIFFHYAESALSWCM